ncbi:putative lipoprotein [Sandaracinus amylolyticus]|uniref:Putative lipoprotein n=1 Tax=Sandaracinus amylolyticus TaxID=927083 RepID=A0A0F6YHJ6_9BACT|nr:putative lipoprotein [Sandaracinus amylolyticus]
MKTILAQLALALSVASIAHAQPLTAAERAIVDAVPSEVVPEPDEHYPGSNEWRHDLFFDAIRDVGGAFVGVGTDQCYTLAAVQGASLLWIVDYDPLVARVHRMYGALVRASPTPDVFLARFTDAAADDTRTLLEGALASDPERVEIVRTLRRNRARFEGYLRHVASLRRDGRATSWLSDPALYARVRALFESDRVIVRTGDVTARTTLRAVGAASERLGTPVRVLYLSNAEAFFGYTRDLAANVEALPTDARSVVLRTFRHPRAVYPAGDTWHYLVQTTSDFEARLALGYRRVRQIVRDAITQGLDARGVTSIDERTPRRAHRP